MHSLRPDEASGRIGCAGGRRGSRVHVLGGQDRWRRPALKGSGLDKERVLRLFGEISVWKRGDQRAPHKPLLLLYALGKCARGEGREIP